MTAGQRVKLTFSEILTMLARAARFTSQSEGDWKHDNAAHVAFLVLSARFEWALEDSAECSLQDAPGLNVVARSPESSVSVDTWGKVLFDITQIPVTAVRRAERRIVTLM